MNTRTAALLLGLATLAALGPAAKPASAQTFVTDTTPGFFTFTVPTGVTSLFVQLDGAGGGGIGSVGGSGAFVSGDLSVTGGETLQLLVGGGGSQGSVTGGGAVGGGFGGGGGGYFGGGGRSAIQSSGGTDSSAAADLVDAGGGGGSGSGSGSSGGSGGYVGGYGHDGAAILSAGGGTQTSGGAGNPEGGGFGFGGSGSAFDGGGGGGGGYFGGGGSNIGGGGGGSSLVSALTAGSFGPVVVKSGGAMNGANGFTSLDGGNGEIILINAMPAAVPEASTTVSLGLLLALGVGGAAWKARKRKAV